MYLRPVNETIAPGSRRREKTNLRHLKKGNLDARGGGGSDKLDVIVDSEFERSRMGSGSMRTNFCRL